jgi:hypothetical protein
LAIKAAVKIDKEIAGLSDDLVQQIKALVDPLALDRGHHRKMHLGEIEAFLKTKRKKLLFLAFALAKKSMLYFSSALKL